MDEKSAKRTLKVLRLLQQRQDARQGAAAQALANLALQRQELLDIQTRLADLNLASTIRFRNRLDQISKSQSQHEAEKAAALRELRRLKGVLNGVEGLIEKARDAEIEKESQETLEEWTARLLSQA